MIPAVLVLLGIHSLAMLAHLKPLIFVSGLPLAFYVPGALLVWAATPGPFIGHAGRVERLGLSVVLSAALLALAALLLDVTPFGITGPSLTGAVAALVPLAILLRWLVARTRA